jgi:hypothetical protein
MLQEPQFVDAATLQIFWEPRIVEADGVRPVAIVGKCETTAVLQDNLQSHENYCCFENTRAPTWRRSNPGYGVSQFFLKAEALISNNAP